MPLAMLLSSIVLPALGGLTISARWPLPIGLTRLTRRWLRFFGSDSRLISSIGWIGVRSPKSGRRRAVSVSTPLTLSTRIRPQYFSPSRGARTAPVTRSPMRRPKRRTWLERHVDVVRAGQQAVAAHEAVAVVDDVEDAEGVVEPGALGLAPGGSGRPGRRGGPSPRVLDLEVLDDLAELLDRHLAQVADVEVVALAGGLELGYLVLLGDGQAIGGLGATARPAVAAGALVGAVRHGGGHTSRGGVPSPAESGGERMGRATGRCSRGIGVPSRAAGGDGRSISERAPAWRQCASRACVTRACRGRSRAAASPGSTKP